MDISRLSNPSIVGPGMWYKMHVDALNATTDEHKRTFIVNINKSCDTFKCMKCKMHFRKFIDDHPFMYYWNLKDSKGRDVGFFKWTWELHNNVNKMLGKYQPSFDEAYDLYNDENAICTDCGNDNVKPQFESNKFIKPINKTTPSNLPILRTKKPIEQIKTPQLKLIARRN